MSFALGVNDTYEHDRFLILLKQQKFWALVITPEFATWFYQENLPLIKFPVFQNSELRNQNS